MNKTININLANTFFHIDEDAYQRLQHYLDAVKRSFANTQGKDEILSDIEARIAELFSERLEHERQVITMKQVDEIIAIMGQPEDYMVDEEIFSDEPGQSSEYTTKSAKKLFRDPDNKYVGGVCSGLGYYLGIDVLWVRLIFIITTIVSAGFGIIAYILFWVLVPEASTTSEKISMTGEPVNISNIEKKIKEGFDNVADKVKSVDYDRMGKNVKDGSRTFFDTVGNILVFLLKIIGKFIGIILLLVAAVALIALFVGLFTAGSVDLFGNHHWTDFVNLAVDIPLWVMSLLLFLAVGIPFFMLFYLGLKILVDNMNSMGNFAKYSLLGIWILAVSALIGMGINIASQHSFSGRHLQTEPLTMDVQDTLIVGMRSNSYYDSRYLRNSEFDIVMDGDFKKLYSDDIRFYIKKAEEGETKLEILKEAKGGNYEDATDRAEKIDFSYSLNGNKLLLDDYLTTNFENKYREQQARVYIYVPVGGIVKLEKSTYGHIGSIENDRDYYRSMMIDHLWQMTDDGELNCLDCAELETEEGDEPKDQDQVETTDEAGDADSIKENIKTDSVIQPKTDTLKVQ
ncbi:PspC domain-containing protein [Robertkochia solimangrovi]|uniref:PspC domain-containing protein n=1 Tax=Robertkochia solimangrovi TaxID=2213046 RepID=UPI00117C6000|nr:PspC domain-containing protein [Robertkochia solimangrovi]TRZ41086.1 hypothetical protein DMZ48_18340 [Robertkochia solimangrovi]